MHLWKQLFTGCFGAPSAGSGCRNTGTVKRAPSAGSAPTEPCRQEMVETVEELTLCSFLSTANCQSLPEDLRLASVKSSSRPEPQCPRASEDELLSTVVSKQTEGIKPLVKADGPAQEPLAYVAPAAAGWPATGSTPSPCRPTRPAVGSARISAALSAVQHPTPNGSATATRAASSLADASSASAATATTKAAAAHSDVDDRDPTFDDLYDIEPDSDSDSAQIPPDSRSSLDSPMRPGTTPLTSASHSAAIPSITRHMLVAAGTSPPSRPAAGHGYGTSTPAAAVADDRSFPYSTSFSTSAGRLQVPSLSSSPSASFTTPLAAPASPARQWAAAGVSGLTTPRLTVYGSMAVMLADLRGLQMLRQPASCGGGVGLCRGGGCGGLGQCVFMRGRLANGAHVIIHFLGCRALHPGTAPALRNVMLAGSAVHPAIARVLGMRFVPSGAVTGAGLGLRPAAPRAPAPRAAAANTHGSAPDVQGSMPSQLSAPVVDAAMEPAQVAPTAPGAVPTSRATPASVTSAAADVAASGDSQLSRVVPELLSRLGLQPGEGVLAVVCEGSAMGTLESLLGGAHNPFRPSRSWPTYMARRTLLRTAMEVAGALAHLHGRGFVHGALRPANVLLVPSSQDRRNFRTKVFGASVRCVKLLGSSHSAATVSVGYGSSAGGVGVGGGWFSSGGGAGGTVLSLPTNVGRSSSSPQPLMTLSSGFNWPALIDQPDSRAPNEPAGAVAVDVVAARTSSLPLPLPATSGHGGDGGGGSSGCLGPQPARAAAGPSGGSPGAPGLPASPLRCKRSSRLLAVTTSAQSPQQAGARIGSNVGSAAEPDGRAELLLGGGSCPGRPLAATRGGSGGGGGGSAPSPLTLRQRAPSEGQQVFVGASGGSGGAAAVVVRPSRRRLREGLAIPEQLEAEAAEVAAAEEEMGKAHVWRSRRIDGSGGGGGGDNNGIRSSRGPRRSASAIELTMPTSQRDVCSVAAEQEPGTRSLSFTSGAVPSSALPSIGGSAPATAPRLALFLRAVMPGGRTELPPQPSSPSQSGSLSRFASPITVATFLSKRPSSKAVHAQGNRGPGDGPARPPSVSGALPRRINSVAAFLSKRPSEKDVNSHRNRSAGGDAAPPPSPSLSGLHGRRVHSITLAMLFSKRASQKAVRAGDAAAAPPPPSLSGSLPRRVSLVASLLAKRPSQKAVIVHSNGATADEGTPAFSGLPPRRVNSFVMSSPVASSVVALLSKRPSQKAVRAQGSRSVGGGNITTGTSPAGLRGSYWQQRAGASRLRLWLGADSDSGCGPPAVAGTAAGVAAPSGTASCRVVRAVSSPALTPAPDSPFATPAATAASQYRRGSDDDGRNVQATPPPTPVSASASPRPNMSAATVGPDVTPWLSSATDNATSGPNTPLHSCAAASNTGCSTAASAIASGAVAGDHAVCGPGSGTASAIDKQSSAGGGAAAAGCAIDEVGDAGAVGAMRCPTGDDGGGTKSGSSGDGGHGNAGWRDELFICPEAQSDLRCRADPAQDTWAFGMVLWALAAGEPPARTGTAAADTEVEAAVQAGDNSAGATPLSRPRALSTLDLEVELGVRAPEWPSAGACGQTHDHLRPLYEACVAPDPAARPPMAKVLATLDLLERAARDDNARRQLMAAVAASGSYVVVPDDQQNQQQQNQNQRAFSHARTGQQQQQQQREQQKQRGAPLVQGRQHLGRGRGAHQ